MGVNDRPMKFTRNRVAIMGRIPGRPSTAAKPSRRGRRRLDELRLLVEEDEQEQGDAAGGGGDHESETHPDGVGEQAAGEGTDGGGQDLRGLDAADRAAGLIARGERGGHGQAQRPHAAEEADGGAQREELPHRRDGPRQREQDHVGREHAHGHRLLPVAVAQAAPHRGQEPGQQGRDADEHARPGRGRLVAGDAELADVQREEGQDEREAHEHHEDGDAAPRAGCAARLPAAGEAVTRGVAPGR